MLNNEETLFSTMKKVTCAGVSAHLVVICLLVVGQTREPQQDHSLCSRVHLYDEACSQLVCPLIYVQSLLYGPLATCHTLHVHTGLKAHLPLTSRTNVIAGLHLSIFSCYTVVLYRLSIPGNDAIATFPFIHFLTAAASVFSGSPFILPRATWFCRCTCATRLKHSKVE